MTEQFTSAQLKIRKDITATLRILGAAGYQYGLAGHITVRDSEDSHQYWVNPAGIPFEHTTLDDLVLVDSQGSTIVGKHDARGYGSQVEILEVRPELSAGLHVHSFYSFAWSSHGGKLRALNTDSAWIAGLQSTRHSFKQPITEALEADKRILFQKGHGAITFGETIAEAAFWFISLERAAKTELLLSAASKDEEISDELFQEWQLAPEFAHKQFQVSIENEILRSPEAFGGASPQ